MADKGAKNHSGLRLFCNLTFCYKSVIRFRNGPSRNGIGDRRVSGMRGCRCEIIQKPLMKAVHHSGERSGTLTIPFVRVDEASQQFFLRRGKRRARRKREQHGQIKRYGYKFSNAAGAPRPIKHARAFVTA